MKNDSSGRCVIMSNFAFLKVKFNDLSFKNVCSLFIYHENQYMGSQWTF